MFGLSQSDVLGETLAEAFIAIEGFDEFIETILNDIVSQAEPSRKIISVRTANGQRSLTLTTSRLTATDGEREGKTTGVIAVFSDITEIKELREAEIRLAKELEGQHTELQKAYRKIEENRDELNWILKRVQVARVASTILVIGLFLGVGIWNWGTSNSDGWSDETVLERETGTEGIDELRTMVAESREFRSEITLIGLLEPWQFIKVSSPSDSRLEKTHFKYGQHVNQGERLIDLNIEELLLKYQESKVEYENAYKTVKEFENWENSAEMSRELRSFSKAKMDLDRAESELKTSEFLLEQGLVPASQQEDQKRRYEIQLLDFEAVKQSLAATRARGQGHSKQTAELELVKARKKLHLLEESLQTDSITAPVTGAILPLEPNEKGLAEGQFAKRGDVLLTIADSEKMVAVTLVDETKVTKIKIGQSVTILGDAFPDFRIQGAVSHVSSQANKSVKGSMPHFEVTAELEPLDAAKKNRLRGGMSCQIRIAVYRNPNALMIPIKAIDMQGGIPRLYVLDPDTRVTRVRRVEVGLTSLDSVEVLSGLSSGERVVLP